MDKGLINSADTKLSFNAHLGAILLTNDTGISEWGIF